MRTCDEVLDLISAKLDGELTADEERELAEHLAACPECRALADDLLDLHRVMPAMEVEPPASILGNVMERIRAEEPKVVPFPKRSQPWRKWGSLAAALFVVLAGALTVDYFNGRNSTPAPAPAAVLAITTEGTPAPLPEVRSQTTAKSLPSPEASDTEQVQGTPNAKAVESAPTPEPQPTAAPSVGVNATGKDMRDTPPASTEATPAPSAAAFQAPRTATAVQEPTPSPEQDNTALTPAQALRKLYDVRFAADHPDAQFTDEEAAFGDFKLHYGGFIGSEENGYYYFRLSQKDTVVDEFIVALGQDGAILSKSADGETYENALLTASGQPAS